MTSQRIGYIDIAKGIGILLVIWAHLECCEYVRSAIYLFHMPLFFFISGMFYKDPSDAKVYIQKTLKKYVYPYVFFLLAFVPITLILNLLQTKAGEGIEFFKMFSASKTNVPLWFLMALCAHNVIYTALHKFVNIRHVVCLLFFVMSYIVVTIHVNLPHILIRIGISIFFYWLGNIYRCQEKVRIEAQKKLVIPLILAYFILTIFVTSSDIYTLKLNSNPLLFVLAAVVGIFMTLSMSHFLDSVTQNAAVQFLKLLGTNSLYIFAAHWPMLRLLQLCDIPNTTTNLICEFVLTFFVSIALAFGAKKLLERFYSTVD